MATVEGPAFVGVADYARLMGVSVRTVYSWLSRGAIPGATQAGPQCVHRIPIPADHAS